MHKKLKQSWQTAALNVNAGFRFCAKNCISGISVNVVIHGEKKTNLVSNTLGMRRAASNCPS